MRLLYVIEKMSGFGGMERIFTDKMNWLCQQPDVEVVLMLVWKDPLPLAYNLDSRVKVVRLNVPSIKGGFGFPFALFSYNRFVAQYNPDVTILSWIIGAFFAAYGRKCGKVIYESHHVSNLMKHSWLQTKLQPYVDVVVTLTSQDAKNFPRARRVEVIPNFTNLQFTASADYTHKRCVAVGRLVYQKNYPRMIEIWKHISKKNPDWVLDIYGEGEERGLIEQGIREAGLEGKVVLHGSAKDVVGVLQSASIYLMTSRMEGFPLVLVEAMTCGLPIVAFDCNFGPGKVISDGTTGFLVPYSDDAMFMERLAYLMEHPEIREQMGMAAKEASKKYQPEQIMKEWLRLFQS